MRIEAALIERGCNIFSSMDDVPLNPIPTMTVAEAIHLLHMHKNIARGIDGQPGKSWRRPPRTLDEMRGSILRKLEAFDSWQATTEAEREASTRGLDHTEVYPPLLFAVGGMMLFPAANNLLTLFVALEAFSLARHLRCCLATPPPLPRPRAALNHLLPRASPSGLLPPAKGQAAPATALPSILQPQFPRRADEAPQSLCQYAGKVVLVVNTASYCGFTKQYEGLEALYAQYQARGLVVLGFPSNDFGKQEPGSSKEIADFCFNTYGVKFPMFSKSVVSGAGRNQLYA